MPITQSDINKQLARTIFTHVLSAMKFTLDMEERRYEDGRNDPRFRFFKKTLMSHTYDNLRELFDKLSEMKLIEKTSYDEDLKNGYADTISGGAGYINTKDLDGLLKKEQKVSKKSLKNTTGE